MCWRDDIRMERRCIACGQRYFGDLGHRNCPGWPKPTEAQLKADADAKSAAEEKAQKDAEEPF